MGHIMVTNYCSTTVAHRSVCKAGDEQCWILACLAESEGRLNGHINGAHQMHILGILPSMPDGCRHQGRPSI